MGCVIKQRLALPLLCIKSGSRAPRCALPWHPLPACLQRGALGEASRLLLELKLLADIGLVGLPNAGAWLGGS